MSKHKVKEKKSGDKVPEFVTAQFGGSIDLIHKSKAESEQARESSIEISSSKVELTSAECKSLCQARGITYKTGYEKRVLQYTCSDESVDRYGDIIRQNGWDLNAFRKNSVVMGFHDYGTFPVGNSIKEWVAEDTKQLKMWVLFADKSIDENADKAFRFAESGFMKAGSVGFMPKSVRIPSDKERGELGMSPWGVIYEEQELLEHTICGVPANSNAIQEAINKGIVAKREMKGIVKDDVYKILKDGENADADSTDEGATSDDPETSDNTEGTEPTELEKIVANEVEKQLQAKAGAVLSKKNKQLINEATLSMKAAIEALEGLLQSVEEPNDSNTEDVSSDSELLDFDDEDQTDDDYNDVYSAISMLKEATQNIKKEKM